MSCSFLQSSHTEVAGSEYICHAQRRSVPHPQSSHLFTPFFMWYTAKFRKRCWNYKMINVSLMETPTLLSTRGSFAPSPIYSSSNTGTHSSSTGTNYSSSHGGSEQGAQRASIDTGLCGRMGNMKVLKQRCCVLTLKSSLTVLKLLPDFSQWKVAGGPVCLLTSWYQFVLHTYVSLLVQFSFVAVFPLTLNDHVPPLTFIPACCRSIFTEFRFMNNKPLTRNVPISNSWTVMCSVVCYLSLSCVLRLPSDA